MNEKKRIWLVLGVFGAVALFVWVWFNFRNEAHPLVGMKTLRSDQTGLEKRGQSPGISRDVVADVDYMGDFSAVPPDPKLLEEVRAWWQSKIVFYGQVKDEKGAPIPEAIVDLMINDASPEGISKHRMKTDVSGSFQVLNLKGKHLHIEVGKAGYYKSQESYRSFQYAGPGVNFVPNKSQPEIFRLHKKGQPAMLVALSRDIPLTGKDERININLLNLLSTKISEENVLLEVIRPQAPGSPWTYRLSVERGGLLERTDPFEFQAPEEGYQPDLVIQTKQIVDKDIYLKFANGNYARVRMGFLPGNTYLQVQSRLNPDGSRNLEYHPDYTVQVKRTHAELQLIYSDPEVRRRQREDLIKDLKNDPAYQDFKLSESQEY